MHYIDVQRQRHHYAGLTGTTGVTLRLNGQTGAAFNAFRPAGATAFTFDARLESGAAFVVGVPAHVQPTNPMQFCRPTSGGAGTIVASDVTDIVITCTNSASYTVTGNVTGLAGGAQLALHARYLDVSLGTEGEFTSANVAVSANGQFNPVTIPANVPEANNGVLLVFHADGTFMSAETQLTFLFPAGYGQERGCSPFQTRTRRSR